MSVISTIFTLSNRTVDNCSMVYSLIYSFLVYIFRAWTESLNIISSLLIKITLWKTIPIWSVSWEANNKAVSSCKACLFSKSQTPDFIVISRIMVDSSKNSSLGLCIKSNNFTSDSLTQRQALHWLQQ